MLVGCVSRLADANLTVNDYEPKGEEIRCTPIEDLTPVVSTENSTNTILVKV